MDLSKMELAYDWRGLSRVFYPSVSAATRAAQKAIRPAYFIVEKGNVLSAFSENEDLSEWMGSPIEEALRHFHHRDCVCFERSEVDLWLKEATELTHFHEQSAFIRQRAMESVDSRRLKQEMLSSGKKEHFLLEGFKTWWSRAFPSEFGFLLRLQGASDLANGECKDFALILRKGAPLSFFEPDLSSLSKDRVSSHADVVKYLSEKHLVPVQCMVIRQEDWERWHTSEDPWRDVARGLKDQSVQLVPFRWDLAAMVTARAYLGI